MKIEFTHLRVTVCGECGKVQLREGNEDSDCDAYTIRRGFCQGTVRDLVFRNGQFGMAEEA